MAILILLNVVTLTSHAETNKQLASTREAVVAEKTQSTKLSKRLSDVSEQKATVSTSLKKERAKSDKLKEESKRLQRENADLKAKREAIKLANAQQQKPVTKSQPARQVAVSGNCESWIASAGIQEVAHARDLIQRESGCNPNAVNPSSGACGVAQELPCGKSGCGLGNGACQVAWMNSYVHGRYGSWANAVAHSNANGWY